MSTVTKNRHRAFTIVEVLIAMAILVFGLGGIYSLMVEADRAGHQRLERMQVRWLAHERLSELRAAPYGSLKTWQPGDWLAMNDRVFAKAEIDHSPDGNIEVKVDAGVREETSKEPSNVVTVRGMVAP